MLHIGGMKSEGQHEHQVRVGIKNENAIAP